MASDPRPESAPRTRDIQEVRRMGGRLCRLRTSDQTAAAIFWNVQPMSWSEMARSVAQARGEDARTTAIMVASVARAVAESQELAARLKSRALDPRPLALIRGDATSRIAALDPGWESLLETPEDPEAPCAGCLAVGAAGGTLRQLMKSDAFGALVPFAREFGLTRRFRSVSEMLQESEDSRVWAGLHLRTTAVESTELGLRLAERLARS